jgi:uncharacterized membrane protein
MAGARLMPWKRREFDWTLPGLLAAVLLAVFLAARWLTYDVPYIDEWFSLYKSGAGAYGPLNPIEVVQRIISFDPGGMGAAYYVGLSGWVGLLGPTPMAARLFSLFAGVLAIAWTLRLGKLWFSPRVGIYAALILAGSAFFIDFMHEARAYTLYALLTCIVLELYWRVSRGERARPRLLIALAVSLAALAYTHYVALSVFGVLGIYHVLFVAKNRRWLLTAGAMSAGLLLYLPWIGVMLDVVQQGTQDANRQAAAMSAATAVQQIGLAFSNGSAALLAVLLIAVLLDRRLRRPATLTMVWLVIGLASALIVNAAVPFLVHLRYLIFLWPALALLTALGIESLSRRGLSWRLILGVWIAFGILGSWTLDFNRSLFGYLYRPPAQGIAVATDLIRNTVATDDLVVWHIAEPGREVFSLLIADYLMQGVDARWDQLERMNNSFAQDDNSYLLDVQAVLDSSTLVWRIDVPEIAHTQRTTVVEFALDQDYADCGELMNREDATLHVYAHRPDDLRTFRLNAPHIFGDDASGRTRAQVARMTGSTALADGAPLILVMAWADTGAIDTSNYNVAVHLVSGSNSEIVRQDDYPLPSGSYSCHASAFSTDGLPAGDYALYLMVYNWQTGERLAWNDTPDGRALINGYSVISR